MAAPHDLTEPDAPAGDDALNAAAPPNAIHPETLAELRTWLEQHHGREDGIWLILWKQTSGRPRLAYDAIVEEALCFGWIDSKPNKLDDHRSMLWLAPRKTASGWSRLNKARAERAIANGTMTPAGLARITAAKLDGSWTALDEVEALVVPEDLQVALAGYPDATACFEGFPKSVKRSILEWISTAKTPDTRQKRVTETALKASVNERANQWRPARPTT